MLGDAKERRKQQRVQSDSGLDEGVEVQQTRGTPPMASALHEPPRRPAEQGVADGEAAQEDGEHGGRRLAVGAQQRGQVLLPGHLVDEAREARQHREEQRSEADHHFRLPIAH